MKALRELEPFNLRRVLETSGELSRAPGRHDVVLPCDDHEHGDSHAGQRGARSILQRPNIVQPRSRKAGKHRSFCAGDRIFDVRSGLCHVGAKEVENG